MSRRGSGSLVELLTRNDLGLLVGFETSRAIQNNTLYMLKLALFRTYFICTILNTISVQINNVFFKRKDKQIIVIVL